MRYFPRQPIGLSLPVDLKLESPCTDLPERIRKFFGKTGKWWGTWSSPQSPGGYEAVLAIKKIPNREEAEILYYNAPFPNWYIKKGQWETTATFQEKTDGRVSLFIPHIPWKTHLECWFEGPVFKGAIYNRFMLSRITWKPLV
jgi:hypothetical protein